MSRSKISNVSKIEHNIPTPRSNTYPLKEMNVGDSFVVTRADGEERAELRNKVASAVSYFGTRNNMKFATARLPDGNIRVWRIK